MDGLITFFEILVAIMIVIFVIVVVGTLITGYGLSDADMKEYYRREEEKRRKKEEKKLKSSNRVRIERIRGTKCYRTVR